MRPRNDRVVIVVRGGNVDDVLCDQRHEVILIDYDNIEGGDGVAKYPATVDTGYLEDTLEETRAEVCYRRTRSRS